MNIQKIFLFTTLSVCSILYVVNLFKMEEIKDIYKDKVVEYEQVITTFQDNQCVIDSLQSVLDSLSNRYKMFDKSPGKDMVDILNAIIQVESRGNPNAYAPSEDAVGILQIRKCMVDDVNRILKKRGTFFRYTYQDRWSKDKSIEMFDIFCTYYGLTTAEEMARCWNGGPRGINNPYTIKYWNKVELELEEEYASR